MASIKLMNEDKEPRKKLTKSFDYNRYFLKRLVFEARLEKLECLHSLKTKGQRISNSRTREEGTPAEFLSSDTWNKNELNKSSPRERKKYRGWHTFQLICRCYWNYLNFVVIHFQFLGGHSGFHRVYFLMWCGANIFTIHARRH